ncbi:MAG TPA: SUMF1/EgtB/PvdO family nonheme iron enzyme [Spirochaetota bacterium]|nr:SUMF1/EgtB/PvdO family nonheme iron enzyme [Spirochaetota bacterium]HPO46075.1 SUMF1/EgtB/PvdO family nonheme iron enzyme [Spirochaetota bacterium]
MRPTGGHSLDVLDPALLVEVPAGVYEIGIHLDLPSRLESSWASGGLPTDYLAAAAPKAPARLERVRISRRMVSAVDFGRFVESTGFLTEAEREGWGWTWEGGWKKREGLSWRGPFGGRADDAYRDESDAMPALQISWNDAEAWCSWFSRETGVRARLPREAEWEAFARLVGARSMLDVGTEEARLEFETAEDFFSALKGVFLRGATSHPCGVLWEWTSDWFKAYPGGGPGPDYGEVYRVLRGGSLAGHPLQRCREYRFRRCPTARSPFYSFRFALD